MAERSKSQPPKEASAPAAEATARIALRLKTSDRWLRILEWLMNALSVRYFARADQLTAPRVRQIIAEMLAIRGIDQPAGFVQLQIAWLSEAMIVARTMMMEGSLRPMDRWIKLTSELDRYYGFAPSQIPTVPTIGLAGPERRSIPPIPAVGAVEGKFSTPQAVEIPQNRERILGAAAGVRQRPSDARPRRIRPAERTKGISVAGIAPREGVTAKRSRPEMAPQRLEKIESAPGNGMVSAASNPQHLVRRRAADGLTRRNAAAQPSPSLRVGLPRLRDLQSCRKRRLTF